MIGQCYNRGDYRELDRTEQRFKQLVKASLEMLAFQCAEVLNLKMLVLMYVLTSVFSDFSVEYLRSAQYMREQILNNKSSK